MMLPPMADEDAAITATLFETLDVTVADPNPDAICVNLLESWSCTPLYTMETTSPLAVFTVRGKQQFSCEKFSYAR